MRHWRQSKVNILAWGVAFVLGYGALAPAEELIRVENALPQIFAGATAFERKAVTLSEAQVARVQEQAGVTFKGTHSREVTVHIAQDGAEILGYVFEDIVQGKWGPIHYLVGVDRSGAVQEIAVLDYEEIRGRPIAKKRFLRQYTGKTIADPLRLRKDIDGVTGATISSRSLTNGTRKILYIYKVLQEDKVLSP